MERDLGHVEIMLQSEAERIKIKLEEAEKEWGEIVNPFWQFLKGYQLIGNRGAFSQDKIVEYQYLIP